MSRPPYEHHIGRLVRKRTILGILGIVAVVLLVAAACGEDATPMPVPATATPAPATATPMPPTPEPSTTLRPPSEWTTENPATLAEIEAELEKHRGESIVYGTWGGAYTGAERQAWLQPLADKFGIIVQDDSTANPNAKMRAMAEAGYIDWDLAVGTTPVFAQLGDLGLLEPLDKSVVDNRHFAGATRNSPYLAGGGGVESHPLAYNTNTYPTEDSRPKTWADFFDVENFPGIRALDKRAWTWIHVLYAAYWSRHPDYIHTTDDRLSQDKIDEAYGILDQLKPHIDVWTASTADCPQLLISGEVDMCYTANGRISDAIMAGDPLGIAWDAGHLLDTFPQAIPMGLRKQDPKVFELTQLVMAWMSFPEVDARLAQFIAYAPINEDAWPLLNNSEFDKQRPWLPTSPQNAKYGYLHNENWVTEVNEEQSNRYFEWIGQD